MAEGEKPYTNGIRFVDPSRRETERFEASKKNGKGKVKENKGEEIANDSLLDGLDPESEDYKQKQKFLLEKFEEEKKLLADARAKAKATGVSVAETDSIEEIQRKITEHELSAPKPEASETPAVRPEIKIQPEPQKIERIQDDPVVLRYETKIKALNDADPELVKAKEKDKNWGPVWKKINDRNSDKMYDEMLEKDPETAVRWQHESPHIQHAIDRKMRVQKVSDKILSQEKKSSDKPAPAKFERPSADPNVKAIEDQTGLGQMDKAKAAALWDLYVARNTADARNYAEKSKPIREALARFDANPKPQPPKASPVLTDEQKNRQEIYDNLPKQMKAWGLDDVKIKEVMLSEDPEKVAAKLGEQLQKIEKFKQKYVGVNKDTDKITVDDSIRETGTPSIAKTRDFATAMKVRLERDPDLKYEDLNASTSKERDEKFKQVVRKVWNDFVVHGKAGRTKEGKIIIYRNTDLDGRGVAGLLHRAGLDTKNIEYVASGQSKKGKTNIDTGNRDGVVVEDNGDTIYLDHHTADSGHGNSATKVAYELLVENGLLERMPEYDKVVDFITKCDNMSFPPEAYGVGSERTLVGLRNDLGFPELVKLFAQGKEPTTPLTDAELKHVAAKPHIRWQDNKKIVTPKTLYDKSQSRKQLLDKSEKIIAEMEQDGFIIDSKTYGKIIINLRNTLPLGGDVAKAHGAGAYVAWNPDNNSFFLSTFGAPLEHKFSDGIPIRDTMWIRPQTDERPMNAKLDEILTTLTENQFTPTGKLRAYLDESKVAPELMTEKVAQDAILGKSSEELAKEREAQDAILGKQERTVAEMDAADTLLGPDSERIRRNKEATDQLLGKETDLVVEKQEGRRKVYAAEMSDYIDAYARQEARRQWEELMAKSNFFRRVQLHMGENYFVDVKLYNQIRESIEKNKVLTTLIETRVAGRDVKIQRGEDQAYRLVDAIMEAYEKDLGLKEQEKAEKVEDKEFDSKVGELMYLFVKHNWDRPTFDANFNNLVSKVYKKRNSSDGHEGRVFASNIYKFALEYKDQIQGLIEKYGEGAAEQVNGLMALDIYLGKIDADIQKEPKKLNALENVPAWLQKNKLFGVIANPAVYGSVASLAGRAATTRGGKVLATATAAYLLPTVSPLLVALGAGAAAGAAYTALRRGKELKEDWSQQRREMAMGRLKPDKGMSEYMVIMADATRTAEKIKAVKEKDRESVKLLAQVYAGLDLEDAGEQNFFRASVANSDLGSRRADMNKLYEALKEIESRPGFSRNEIEKSIEEEKTGLRNLLNEKEDKFNNFKRTQIRRAALQGAVTSIAGAVITQEAIYWGKEAINALGGEVNVGDTLLHSGIRKVIAGSEWHKHYLGSLSEKGAITGVLDHVQSSTHSPEGFDFSQNPDGTVDYVYHGEHVADHLKLDPEGKGLAEEAKQILRDKGFVVTDWHGQTQVNVEIARGIVAGQMPEATLENLQGKYPEGDWGVHHRIDWHHEGPQESSWFNRVIEHPGKEQMLYISKEGGHATVDAHKILENLKQNLVDGQDHAFTNPDGSVDSKMGDLYAKLADWNRKGELGKHLRAVIIPDHGSPISASFAADSTGKIALPESLSNLITDPRDGHLPFMVELRLDDGHVLATASGGNGMFTQAVSEVTGSTPKTIEFFKTYIVPPVTEGMEPMLSTPAAARYPLKRAEVRTSQVTLPEPIAPASSRRGSEESVVDLGDNLGTRADEPLDLELNPNSIDTTEKQADLPLGFRKPQRTIGTGLIRRRELGTSMNEKLVGTSLVSRKLLDKMQMQRPELGSSLHGLKELGPSPFEPVAGEAVELFDPAAAIDFLRKLDQFRGRKFDDLELELTQTFDQLKALLPHKTRLKEMFTELMTLFGFERKDWNFTKDGYIHLKKLSNAILTAKWHEAHPKEFRGFLAEISADRGSASIAKFAKQRKKMEPRYDQKRRKTPGKKQEDPLSEFLSEQDIKREDKPQQAKRTALDEFDSEEK